VAAMGLQAVFAAIDGAESVFGRVVNTARETSIGGWLTLLAGVIGGIVLGRLVAMLLRKAGTRFESRGWRGRKILFCGAAGPVSLAIFTLGLGVGLAPVHLSPEARAFAGRVLALLYIFAAAWAVYNAAELVDVALHQWTSRRKTSRLDEGIATLVRKSLRAFLVVTFVLFAAQNVLGADIGAWLAGLGIAGLAVSLAAQDSIRNVFGSLMIFLDRPFTVGDQIQFDRWEGTVEEIGFRSTRMRTVAGELVTIGNARLADNPVVNLSRRAHARRAITLTLAKETPPEQVERALQILRELMAEEEITAGFDTERHPPRVVLEDIVAGAATIRIYYWFNSADAWGFAAHAEKVNLRVIRALAANEIRLA
jgi:MscS family membrane protein